VNVKQISQIMKGDSQRNRREMHMGNTGAHVPSQCAFFAINDGTITAIQQKSSVIFTLFAVYDRTCFAFFPKNKAEQYPPLAAG